MRFKDSMDNAAGGITMINFGEASFSLADSILPCVPSTAVLMQELGLDADDKTKHAVEAQEKSPEDEDDKVDSVNNIITIVVVTAALASLILGIAVMYAEQTLVAYVAFSFPVVISPYAIYQRLKIQQLPTFRNVHNRLRDAVCEMAMKRNKLANENSRLERQVTRLSAVEGRLEHILKREGKDVEYFKRVVYHNGATLREMQKLQAAIDLQELFSIVIGSDRDGDNVISDREMNEFLLRLKHYAGTRRGGRQLTFNEAAVREAFSKSLTRTVQSLINVATSMAEDDEELGSRVGGKWSRCNDPPGFEGSSMNPVDVTNLKANEDILLDGLLSSNSVEYETASHASS